MAQGSTNQANIRKCLPYILFLVCFGFVTSEEYYIVSSLSDPCCAKNCLMLSQFAETFTNCSNCDNTTLIFVPGNHSLESDLIIEDVYSFSMYTEPSSSNTWINCSLDTKLEFRNIRTVTINGLDFIECSENQLEFVGQFHLTDSTIYSHPELDGTTLTIAESTAYLDRVAFLSTIENASLQLDNCTLESATIYRILAIKSVVIITRGLFDRSIVGVGAVVYSIDSSKIAIFNSTFRNNRAMCWNFDTQYNSSRRVGAILQAYNSSMDVCDGKFEYNQGDIIVTVGGISKFAHCVFSNHFRLYKDINVEAIVSVYDSNVSVSYSTFLNNTITTLGAFYSNTSVSNSKFFGNVQCLGIFGGQISIDYTTFASNEFMLLSALDVKKTNLYHNEFENNTAFDMIRLSTEMVTIKLNAFIGNKADYALVWIAYHILPGTIVNNVFIKNSAVYDVAISSDCKPGLSLSLGTSRCIECPKNWYFNLFGLIIAAFFAGILLIILILVLNLTVAVGTLNGILFYANIVASNMDAYFPLSSTPNFASIFISWLNLDIGFDICFFKEMTIDAKAMLQLAFPAYVISLVVIIIVISEYSSKFARIIGKGDPIAVLATMILISYANLLKAVIKAASLLYLKPAYGSLNFNPANFIDYRKEYYNSYFDYTDIGYTLIAISSLILLIGSLYTALVFFWQWLIQYQHNTIFKWVRYQKLQHFMEPYLAPYSVKYRYWTGLLLIVRLILFSVSAINLTIDPRVDFVSTIFVIGCLILFRVVVVKKLYKNMLLDVMETTIYFNLVFFAAFTWYSLDFGGNQVAVAYISVMIIFALFLAIIVFHILRFSGLYKLSFVQQLLKWIASKLAGKKPTRENLDRNEPDEIDGLLLHRARPHVSYSVVEIPKNETEAT